MEFLDHFPAGCAHRLRDTEYAIAAVVAVLMVAMLSFSAATPGKSAAGDRDSPAAKNRVTPRTPLCHKPAISPEPPPC